MNNLIRKYFSFFSLACLLLGAASPAWAAGCQSDISAVDAKIRAQYGGDYSKWWTWLSCPVCLGSELKKDAIVTKTQIKEISSYRNIAYMQLRRGNERQCLAEVKNAKRMLKL
jgi:hypothetical protein